MKFSSVTLYFYPLITEFDFVWGKGLPERIEGRGWKEGNMTSCNATQQTFVVSLGYLRVAAEILTCRTDFR